MSEQIYTLDEYLHMSFEHDAEFLDGKVVDRLGGEMDHSTVQAAAMFLLAEAPGVHALPALSVQVSHTRVRVVDVCVISKSAPREQIIQTPPVLCVEVLNNEDLFQDMLDRVYDYLKMGVSEVWLFDPATRLVYVCVDGGITIHANGSLQVPGVAFAASIETIFASLDE